MAGQYATPEKLRPSGNTMINFGYAAGVLTSSKPGVDWTVSGSNVSSEVIETNLPSRADPALMRTRICSVSKPIVASAIVLAGREQPGALDRPVIEYLPELGDSWRIGAGRTVSKRAKRFGKSHLRN